VSWLRAIRPATAAVIVILLLPLLLPDALLTIYIFIGLSTMVVSGLSLLMGFAGQVSLGQAAFYAIGAYTAGLLAKDLMLPPLLALAVARPPRPASPTSSVCPCSACAATTSPSARSPFSSSRCQPSAKPET